MVTEIFINNTQIDLSEDLSIPLNYAIADIREPQKRNTNFSKTVVLPGTASNNVLFSHIWDIGVNLISSGNTNFNPTFNPNLKADVLVLQDGNEVFKGFAKLDNIVNTDGKVEYEMSFYGNLANIFTTLGESKLSDLDLSEYDHTYNKTNQTNSWATSIIKNGSTYVNFSGGNPTGEGYVYPMIDYGFGNGTSFDVRHFYPAVYVKTIIDKIFSEAGFQYQSTFFTSQFFKRLIIPYTENTLRYSDAQLAQITSQASNLSSMPYSAGPGTNPTWWNLQGQILQFNNDSTAPNVDLGNNFNTSTYKYTAPKAGNYFITLYVAINVKHNNSTSPDTLFYQGSLPSQIFRSIGTIDIKGGGNTLLNSISVFLTTSLNVTVTGNALLVLVPTNITSGTTTSTYYYSIQTNVYLTAGQQVWGAYNSTISNIYKFGGTCTVNFEPATYLNVKYNDLTLAEGDTLTMNQILSQKVKQVDFLSSIFKMFNLYVDQDNTTSNKLIIETRDDYFASSGGTTLDWSYKLDYSKAYELKPMGDLESRNYLYTYKDDSDYYNELYKKKFGEIYGQKDYDINNDFLKEEVKTELIFSPTPLADYIGIDRIIPKIFTVDNNNQPKPKPANIRILYYGGVKTTNQPYSYVASSGSVFHTDYAYAGHLDDTLNPTIDLNFGPPIEVFYTAFNYTNNNLFNKYWRKFIQEISDFNSKIFVGYFYLTPLDIQKLSFKDTYYFEGEYWRLNRIFDYNPNQLSVTKCEFIKLIEYPTFVPTNTLTGGGGVLEDDVTGQYNFQRTGTVQGVESLGEFITINDSSIGTRVNGSNIYVSNNTFGISVLSSSGISVYDGNRFGSVLSSKESSLNNGEFVSVIASSGVVVAEETEFTTVINSVGTQIDKSGALYINGLPIKDTGSAVRVKSITANYTAEWSDTVLLVNATGGNITVTLPDSGTVSSTKDEMGKIFHVKKVDASANTVTIDGFSTQTIDGATTKVLTTQYDSISIVSDGSNWHKL